MPRSSISGAISRITALKAREQRRTERQHPREEEEAGHGEEPADRPGEQFGPLRVADPCEHVVGDDLDDDQE